MTKNTFFIFLTLTIYFVACNGKKPNIATKQSPPTSDTITDKDEQIALFQSDTAIINKKKFVLSVFKNDTISYFKVEKSLGTSFKTILVDSDYETNNSDLFFKDENNDGYLDIVWTKKWQDHSYLFNPIKDNFYEVGEFHDIDTLKINGQAVLFKNKYPLLYLQNLEKEMGWMTELHSELFIIDNTYKKISFATIDNFASLEDWNINKCVHSKSVVINCYVPPYSPKYGDLSIWNTGKSIDSFNVKSKEFDSAYIVRYWTNHYQKLLRYGQIFHVRRATELEYY